MEDEATVWTHLRGSVINKKTGKLNPALRHGYGLWPLGLMECKKDIPGPFVQRNIPEQPCDASGIRVAFAAMLPATHRQQAP